MTTDHFMSEITVPRAYQWPRFSTVATQALAWEAKMAPNVCNVSI